MTIDEMIESLLKAKKDLGGGEALALEIHCKGKVHIALLDDLMYSKFTGLTVEIEAPWWYYKENGNVHKKRD